MPRKADPDEEGVARKPRLRYNPPTRTKALARIGRGDTLASIARDMGIDEATLRRWKTTDIELAASQADLQDKYLREAYAASLEMVQELRSRIPDMKDGQLYVAFGIVSDKIARIEEQRIIAKELSESRPAAAPTQEYTDADWWREIPAIGPTEEAPRERGD